jgi:hypothetical protein
MEAKFESDMGRLVEKEERLLREVTEKLTADTRLENRHLIEEESRIESKHREIERDLQTQIKNTEMEFEQLRASHGAKLCEKEHLMERMRKCECVKLGFEVEEERSKLLRLSDEVEQGKAKAIEAERSERMRIWETKDVLESIEAENAKLRDELKQLEDDSEAQRRAAEMQLAALQDRHQKEIEMIGVRVRQTVEKKDAMIQQLMNRLDSVGGTTNDF